MLVVNSAYRLKRIGSYHELAAALDIYLQNTNATVRTPINEIVYWSERYNKTYCDDLMIFAFYINNVMCGYAQLVYFYDEMLLFIDHIAIDKNFRKANSFAILMDQLNEYCVDLQIKNIATEIASANCNPMKRLLEIIGFVGSEFSYYQPQLGSNSESQHNAELLIKQIRDDSVPLDFGKYLALVKTIYYKHYLRWYMPLQDVPMAYKAKLDVLYENIVSDYLK